MNVRNKQNQENTFLRIGQKSRCINVVNLITKNSIEEKILAGINLKTALFDGVFEGATDTVEFSQAKRAEMLNRQTGHRSDPSMGRPHGDGLRPEDNGDP
jgi:hypothetical protein